MKRTRTAKKNKSIKVKRRLGGSRGSRIPRGSRGSRRVSTHAFEADKRKTTGTYNIHNNNNNHTKSKKGLPVTESSDVVPTESRPYSGRSKIYAHKLMPLVALAALGSIPESNALSQRDWLPSATACVKYNGLWNSQTLQCSGAHNLSDDTKKVNKGLECVSNGGTWNPALTGFCQRPFKPSKR